MDAGIQKNILKTSRSDSNNSNELFDSSETFFTANSPSFFNDNKVKKYFSFIIEKPTQKQYKDRFYFFEKDKSDACKLFEQLILSDTENMFKLQKLDTVNGISYSLKPQKRTVNIKLLLNNLLLINQTENDALYKPNNTFKKTYFSKDNKYTNFKTLENILKISNTSMFCQNKNKLIFNVLCNRNYPTVQKNIIMHILSNKKPWHSNTHFIPLQICIPTNNNYFLKIPQEFKIIEMVLLNDFINFLNMVNHQNSITEYHINVNVYKIKMKEELPLRYPIWLVKEIYLFILKQVCACSELEKFFTVYFYKFIVGNNVCYNLPDGSVYKRHVHNVNKSKHNNHNMSNFENLNYLDSEFTKIISKLSIFMILIEFCREQEIEMCSLYYNINGEIVLIVDNGPQMTKKINESFKQVFYIDDVEKGVDKMFEISELI